MSGPNDFHIESVNGVLTLQPGLGSDEPAAAPSLAALELAEPPKTQALRQQQRELDAREKVLAEIEAELAAKQAALDAREVALNQIAS